jgi:hypothetical protein
MRCSSGDRLPWARARLRPRPRRLALRPRLRKARTNPNPTRRRLCRRQPRPRRRSRQSRPQRGCVAHRKAWNLACLCRGRRRRAAPRRPRHKPLRCPQNGIQARTLRNKRRKGPSKVAAIATLPKAFVLTHDRIRNVCRRLFGIMLQRSAPFRSCCRFGFGHIGGGLLRAARRDCFRLEEGFRQRCSFRGRLLACFL